MDGTIAAVFLIASLTDMALTDCRTDGCFATSDTVARTSIGFGEVEFQGKLVGNEIYVRHDFARNYGPFQPSIGISVTDSDDVWVGFGAVYNVDTGTDRFYTQLSLLPGIYSRGSGPDLGHDIEFRSAAEIGYQARNGVRIGLSYDHRSNMGFSSTNPGLETFQVRVTFPTKRR